LNDKRIIEVVDYSKDWPELFQREVEKLREVFGELAVAIHHIGSTAINGIKAKPTIDIIIEVSDINKVDIYNKEMEALSYIPKGENGIVGRRYFQKGQPQHTHHVHVFQLGDEEIDRHIIFRDYLNSHPHIAEEYSSLKEKLALKYKHDGISYTEGKSDFIKKIDIDAKIWKLGQKK